MTDYKLWKLLFTPKQMPEDQTIEVTVVIDFRSNPQLPMEKTVTVPAKSTVFDALSIAAPVVTSRKFGMDCFVEAIAGIRNDFAGDRGWHFEVNGYRSNVPAERYLVKDGDLIKWLYLGAP
jgi:hypothetical protein